MSISLVQRKGMQPSGHCRNPVTWYMRTNPTRWKCFPYSAAVYTPSLTFCCILSNWWRQLHPIFERSSRSTRLLFEPLCFKFSELGLAHSPILNAILIWNSCRKPPSVVCASRFTPPGTCRWLEKTGDTVLQWGGGGDTCRPYSRYGHTFFALLIRSTWGYAN